MFVVFIFTYQLISYISTCSVVYSINVHIMRISYVSIMILERIISFSSDVYFC